MYFCVYKILIFDLTCCRHEQLFKISPMTSLTMPDHMQLQVLRNATLFSLTRHTRSNRRQAGKNRMQTDGNKQRLNVTKQLLVSQELDAINDHLNEIYTWCLDRAMPSSDARRGIYFVRRTMVEEFEARLDIAQSVLKTDLVPAFLTTYDQCREKMKRPAPDGLGDLYVETDYPTQEVLADAFSIEWSWLSLSVPDELPSEVRERESEKLRRSFEEAQEEIRYALRAGFKEMVQHAVDRLSIKPGEKPKVFRSTLVSNFKQFFDTFQAKNLMDDTELAQLVQEAQNVVAGLPKNVDELREIPSIRASAAASFAELNDSLGSLVIEKPSRKFDFED